MEKKYLLPPGLLAHQLEVKEAVSKMPPTSLEEWLATASTIDKLPEVQDLEKERNDTIRERELLAQDLLKIGYRLKSDGDIEPI